MMKFLFALLFLTTAIAFAETHEATISTIDYARNSGEENLLYLSDGHVIRMQDQKDLQTFERLKKENKFIRFNIDKHRKIRSYKIPHSKKLPR